MTITQTYARQKFDEFNKLLFDSSLPEIPISIGKAVSYVGICRFKRSRTLFGRVQLYDFRLCFSSRFDLPEEEWEDTIIHEMIHYYIGLKGIKDTSTHGKVFRKIMDAVNSNYGRHVSVSHKSSPEQARTLREGRPGLRVVAVVELRDGRSGVKVVPRNASRMRAYRNGLMLSGKVASVDFYLSDNVFFGRFPNSSALKVYFLDKEEIGKQLEGAVKL